MSRDQRPGKARLVAGAATPARRADDELPGVVEPADVAPVTGGGLITAVLFLLACASGGAGVAAGRAWGIV